MVNALMELPLSHATVQAHLQARDAKGGSKNAYTSRVKIMEHASRELDHLDIPVCAHPFSLVGASYTFLCSCGVSSQAAQPVPLA